MQLIKLAKEEDKKYYRQNLKHLFIIDKLFYTEKASFVMENTTKAELQASLGSSNLIKSPQIDFAKTGKIEVSFNSGLKVPFAADVESIKDYTD